MTIWEEILRIPPQPLVPEDTTKSKLIRFFISRLKAASEYETCTSDVYFLLLGFYYRTNDTQKAKRKRKLNGGNPRAEVKRYYFRKDDVVLCF